MTLEDLNKGSVDLKKKVAKKLERLMKDGFTAEEMIDMLKSEFNIDLNAQADALWEKTIDWELIIEDDDSIKAFDRKLFLEDVTVFDAYYDAKLHEIFKGLKEFINGYEGIHECGYCYKLFNKSEFDYFLMTEREMNVCGDCCASSPAVAKDSGFDNFSFVTSQMDAIPEDFLVYKEDNINDIIGVLDTLKKIIEYGHSIEFARVMTMGGYHSNDTDYLELYMPTVEKAKEEETISKEHYEFFQKLLNTSNSYYDMENEVDYSVYQLIRITNY